MSEWLELGDRVGEELVLRRRVVQDDGVREKEVEEQDDVPAFVNVGIDADEKVPDERYETEAEVPRKLRIANTLISLFVLGFALVSLMSDLTRIAQELNEETQHRLGEDHQEERDSSRITWTDNRSAEVQKQVRDAFLHAWSGYKKFAWGKDTLHPVRKSGSDDFLGMAISIVDSMDTAWIMGLDDVFDEQYAWVVENMRFDAQEDINVFETTIRILGGLLSAFSLSKRQPLADLAQDLGSRLLPAFDTKTGIPYGTIGLKSGKVYNPAWVKHASSVAEAGTLLLEFRYLSHVTKNVTFRNVVDRTERFFEDQMFDPNSAVCLDGLFPMFIHPETGEVKSKPLITFGARGDSFYEYLLKGYLQTGKKEVWLLEMYEQSMLGMSKHLLRKTSGRKQFVYVGEIDMNEPLNVIPKMDHLVCFLPGLLALGSKHGAGRYTHRSPGLTHLRIAERLMRTCFEMYHSMPLGLAPEIAHFDQKGKPELVAKDGARHCLLRPETVESLFVLWRVTKNPMYRDWGLQIFEKIVENTRVPSGGFSGVSDVTASKPDLNDKMDSFFLAETLKYLYLLFSPDDVIPLDDYVFNTEAHPLPVFYWDS